MKYGDGKFTTLKRWAVGLSGIGVAYCSMILTKQGVGITGDLAWMGTVIALALFCAELMFNSNFDDLNWTIIALGLGAYLYSIWTNVEGFYFYRAIEGNLWTNFDSTNFGGGLFMDIYPELAIAWAMKESKIGDLLGNVVKTAKDPDKLTQSHNQSNRQQNNGQTMGDYPTKAVNRPQYQQNQPKSLSRFPQELKRQRPHPSREPREVSEEPTYHPVSYIPKEKGE